MEYLLIPMAIILACLYILNYHKIKQNNKLFKRWGMPKHITLAETKINFDNYKVRDRSTIIKIIRQAVPYADFGDLHSNQTLQFDIININHSKYLSIKFSIRNAFRLISYKFRVYEDGRVYYKHEEHNCVYNYNLAQNNPFEKLLNNIGE